MSNYWIKLYEEILDDPKMGTLPDRLWRRIIELFLLAGRSQKNGVIPDTLKLAWSLRMNPQELQQDLEQIASTGIIEACPNGWYIPKFSQRQAAATGAERVKQFRKREQKRQYNGDVTEMKRFVTQITDTDTDIDVEQISTTSTTKTLPSEWLTPQMEAQNVIQQVTGLVASPPDQIDKYTETILAVKDSRNGDAVQYLRGFYDDWLSRRTKDGRPYKKTALAWVEWALEGASPPKFEPPPQQPRRRKPIED